MCIRDRQDVYLNEEAYYQKASVEDLNGNSKTWYSEVDKEAGTTAILSLIHIYNQENIATSVREMIEKFQAENPNIAVNVEAIGDQTAYYTKIKTLAASNSLPDVFVCKGSELAAFAKNGLVAPLGEILDEERCV